MDEYSIGLSMIYDIKAQSKKLYDFVKDTDTPRAAENITPYSLSMWTP